MDPKNGGYMQLNPLSKEINKNLKLIILKLSFRKIFILNIILKIRLIK